MKTKFRVLTVALIASAALAGCGGDSGGDFNANANGNGNGNGGGNANACDTATISGVICYINNLIATATLETNDPADISGVTLATDETSDAIPNP